jgi:hypothetical protein
VLLLLALAGPAAGATPFTLDKDGSRPRVAVDHLGTGFFTWTHAVGANNVFRYCRVAQGHTACNASKAYAPGDQDVDGGYALFASGGRVLLLDARCCSVYAQKQVFSSTNGGGTFTGPVSPGYMNGPGDNIGGQALYAPPGAVGRAGESLLTIGDVQSVGVTFQATGTTTGTEVATANLGGPGGSYQASLALQGSSTLVAIYGTLGPDRLYWRKWKGTGDVNDVANWTPPALLDSTDVDSTAKLVSGPSGLYVAYNRGAVSHRAYFLRRFTGTGWGPATRLTEIGSPQGADLVEDGAGRLHFAWQDSSSKLRYRYARTPANTQFTSPQTLVKSGNFPFLKLGVNTSGRGWVAWDGLPGVHAVAVKPGEPPYTKPNKKTKVAFGSKHAVLSSPKLCVGHGQSFLAKVGGDAGVKKVVFHIDGKKRATVTNKPFSKLLGTKVLGSGVHDLIASVTATFKKNGKKKTATKDIAATFRIC